MMLKLLLYAYSIGVTSSREVERRCEVDVAFRWLSANTAPDYRSLARFRRRHLDALGELFCQVLMLCAEAGLVKLGRVALDGTKIRASASRHKAMSYDRLVRRIAEVEAEVAAMLAEAEAVDLSEDDTFGADRRGDEVPAELATREGRLAKMRAAKAALEADAADRAAAAGEDKARRQGKSDDEVGTAIELARSRAVVKPSAQRSFTDPEARMMKTTDGFRYAYNAQAVADDDSQVVVVTWVTQAATDVNLLLPLIEATKSSLDAAGIEPRPKVTLADAGYCSTTNIDTANANGDNVLVATGRLKHNEQIPATPRGRIPNHLTSRQRMARRLRTKNGRADYARRKAIIEPVLGQMKVRQQAGLLRLRGLDGAQGEFTLHAICHNLRKLANHTPPATC